jgi:hypothetical protein
LQHAHAGRARIGDERIDVVDVEAELQRTGPHHQRLAIGMQPQSLAVAEIEIDPIGRGVGADAQFEHVPVKGARTRQIRTDKHRHRKGAHSVHFRPNAAKPLSSPHCQ